MYTYRYIHIRVHVIIDTNNMYNILSMVLLYGILGLSEESTSLKVNN